MAQTNEEAVDKLNSPPKTEETIFGNLSQGDRFLGSLSGVEWLVAWDKELGHLRGLNLATHEVYTIGINARVRKVIT